MNTKDSRAAFYAVFDDGFRKINQPLLHSWVSGQYKPCIFRLRYSEGLPAYRTRAENQHMLF